jgi:hypothetical protein
LFSIGIGGQLETERLAEHLFEWCGVSGGGPEFEFGVSRRLQHQHGVVISVLECYARDDLRVASVQRFCEAEHRREGAYDATPLSG